MGYYRRKYEMSQYIVNNADEGSPPQEVGYLNGIPEWGAHSCEAH